MRIPLGINQNAFDEYAPSREALSLVLEKGRLLKSESLFCQSDHPPRLTEMCVRSIAANFERNNVLWRLPAADRNLLLELLPTDLPLELALQHIQDGIYWRRRVGDRWRDRTNHVEDFGFSWKRMYMERHVQELVEEFSPEGFDLEKVNEMCQLASDYVYKLDLRQLKMVQSPIDEEEDECGVGQQYFDHIDLSPIISGLENLTELHIQFGVRHLGTNYKKTLFELSSDDCKNIGWGVSLAKKLKVLRIHQSALDDDKVISLLSNMENNKSLRKIELSYCLIGDDGAIAMAKYLQRRTNIEEVNLCNNKIGESGMEALSYVLTQADTSPVKILNLRFNAFGNGGLQFLASALIREHSKVEELNLSCCNLDEECGILLAEMLRRNWLLRDLNLSCNHFGEAVGRAIESAMEENKTILHLDLRMTGIPKENMIKIGKNLHFNRIRARRGEKGVEREMQLEKAERGSAEEEEGEMEEATEEAVSLSTGRRNKTESDECDEDAYEENEESDERESR